MAPCWTRKLGALLAFGAINAFAAGLLMLLLSSRLPSSSERRGNGC
jgi:hypothetical protein